jgi:hypothetical protein
MHAMWNLLLQTPHWANLRGTIAPVTEEMKASVRVVQALGQYKINWNYDCERRGLISSLVY